MKKNSKELKEKILSFLTEGLTEEVRQNLQDIHPADLAEIIAAANLAQQIKILRLLEPAKAAQVFLELDREMLPLLIESLGFQRTADILNVMYPDDAADLLGELPAELQHRLLNQMKCQEAEDVRELLEYDKETAGGIMTTEYVAVREDVTAVQTIQTLREIAPDAETVYYVYVVDQQNKLVGVLSLRELIITPPSVLVRDIMRTKVISVHVKTDQEEVARQVAKHDFLAIPVVNDMGELLGIVTVDDVLDVIEEEATEDMMRMAANVDLEGEYPEASPLRRAGRRLPWLIGLLFGELVAGRVIEGYAQTLQHVTTLAFFMTALAGGTGNAATQSLTVVVRGIATREVNPRQIFGVVLREAQVGLYVGLVSGVVLAIFALLWQDAPLLGLVVGFSLTVSILVSTILGSFVPIVFKHIGADPALASGPFIATIMDITSMFIYFTLATLILLP